MNFFRPSLNNQIQIEVQGTEILEKITYQIVGSGSVVKSSIIEVPNESKKFEFKIMATENMAPKSYIIVYYISSEGEIISDKLEIELENELKNIIDVKLSSNQVKPGNDVEINVNSNPDSFVGLMGVDQSVLILKKGNDIEKADVMDELKKFNKQSKDTYSYGNYRDFADSYAIILTNAKSEYSAPIYFSPCGGFGCYPYFGGLGMSNQGMFFNPGPTSLSFGGFGGSAANAAASSQSFQGSGLISGGFSRPPGLSYDDIQPESMEEKKVSKKSTEIRKEFPETWIFESLEFSSKWVFTQLCFNKILM